MAAPAPLRSASSVARTPTPWMKIILRSCLVSGAVLVGGHFFQLETLGLLSALFSTGLLAGAWGGRRQGWLSGIIVGFPLSLQQVTRLAAVDFGGLGAIFSQSDYWRVGVPAAMVAGAMAVLGSMTGAWLQDMKLQKES